MDNNENLNYHFYFNEMQIKQYDAQFTAEEWSRKMMKAVREKKAETTRIRITGILTKMVRISGILGFKSMLNFMPRYMRK